MLNYGFYNMNCMDGMREFPDKFFDIAVVDPPYFAGPNKRRYYGRSESTTLIKRREYDIIDTFVRHISSNGHSWSKSIWIKRDAETWQTEKGE